MPEFLQGALELLAIGVVSSGLVLWWFRPLRQEKAVQPNKRRQDEFSRRRWRIR